MYFTMKQTSDASSIKPKSPMTSLLDNVATAIAITLHPVIIPKQQSLVWSWFINDFVFFAA